MHSTLSKHAEVLLGAPHQQLQAGHVATRPRRRAFQSHDDRLHQPPQLVQVLHKWKVGGQGQLCE